MLCFSVFRAVFFVFCCVVLRCVVLFAFVCLCMSQNTRGHSWKPLLLRVRCNEHMLTYVVLIATIQPDQLFCNV